MGKNLKYQTKEELLATAKALKVTGLSKTMTKADIITKIEAKSSTKAEAKPKPAPKRGEYYR